MKGPKRCYEIKLVADGDSWEDAMQMLRELFNEVEEHGSGCRMVVGGYSSGGLVRITHDHTMTHDRYISALKDFKPQKGFVKALADEFDALTHEANEAHLPADRRHAIRVRQRELFLAVNDIAKKAVPSQEASLQDFARKASLEDFPLKEVPSQPEESYGGYAITMLKQLAAATGDDPEHMTWPQLLHAVRTLREDAQRYQENQDNRGKGHD